MPPNLPEPDKATSHEVSVPMSAAEESRQPLVVGAGLFLAASAFALSATGILWHLHALSVGACLVAGLLVFGLWVSRFGVRRDIPIWALVLLSSLLLIPIAAALTPPQDKDEVAFGATLPRDYALAGRFFYNADYGPYSAFPGNYEALATASLVLLGDVTPARVLSVLLAFGLAVIAFHLSRQVGVSRPVALCAALLVLSAESLLSAAPMVKNDVANAFFQSLALLSIASYAARHEPRNLALGGFFLGTAIGVKYSSLEFALCIVPLTVGLVLTGPGRLSQRLRSVAIFGVVTLAAALPWYARNYVLFDNPFFPFLNEILGAHNGFTAEHSALTREMFNGWSGYSWRTGTASGFLSGVTRGFGWVPVVLSVPGALVAVVRRRDAVSWFLGVALLSLGLVTLFAGYWLPRYFFSVLVLSSVFAAVALSEILRAAGPVLGRRALVVALGLLALALGGSTLRWEWRTRGRCVRDAVYIKRHAQEFVRTNVRHWEVADWVNRNLGPDDRIGVGMNVQPFYYMRRPYFHIHPMTEKGNLQSLRTPEEFLQAFRALGLTWLAYSPHSDAGYPVATAPRMNAFLWRFDRARKALAQSGKLTPVTTIQGVRIYRIEGPRRGIASP
jgi:hypothetical protein